MPEYSIRGWGLLMRIFLLAVLVVGSGHRGMASPALDVLARLGNGSGAGSGSGTPPALQGAQGGQTQSITCDMATLPKEYLDQFSPEGNLQVSVEGGKLELSALSAPQCFNGSADAPIAIGLEGGTPGGHYIIAARINSKYSQDEGAFAVALTQCYTANKNNFGQITFDLATPETRPIAWGVSANNFALAGDMGSTLTGEFSDTNCFKRQSLADSGPLMVYGSEDSFNGDYIGACSDCMSPLSDALQANIDNLTHAVRMSAIGSLEQGVVRYAKAVKEKTGSSELNSFEGKLLGKLNHYLWENGGLVGQYKEIMSELSDMDSGSSAYEQKQQEKEDIEQFLQLLADTFKPEKAGNALSHLKKHHAYDAAEKVSFIGISAYGAIRQGSSPILTRSQVIEVHMKWVKRVLEPAEKLNYAYENPGAGVSDSYQERYEDKISGYRNLSKNYSQWQRKANRQLYKACNKSFGPFTQRARERLYRNCQKTQESMGEDSNRRRQEMLRQLQQAQAFERHAISFREAERKGFIQARERGDFFEDDFGYSDDLYSPYLDDHSFYKEYGSDNADRNFSLMSRQQFNYNDPMLMAEMGARQPGFPDHNNFSPTMFHQGPPSYAMPPNFNQWEVQSYPQRSPAGWFVPPGR